MCSCLQLLPVLPLTSTLTSAAFPTDPKFQGFSHQTLTIYFWGLKHWRLLFFTITIRTSDATNISIYVTMTIAIFTTSIIIVSVQITITLLYMFYDYDLDYSCC